MIKENEKLVSIIPEPVKMKISPGKFTLNKDTIIFVDKHCKENGNYLKRMLAPATGLNFSIKNITEMNTKDNNIVLKLDPKQKKYGPEGYILKIKPNSITISALAIAGIFYGIQSIRQLLSEEIESPKLVKNIEWSLPCVQIRDYPRFSHRGFMLDVGRHFFDKEVIKKILDVLSLLKMNVFHWHLTEDQGWRIEINKYPKLIAIGSKRKGSQIGGFASKTTDSIPHQGYFTQRDIRETISYAKERFIKVIPEIEMPGHSMAALASYPEMSCTGGPFEIPVFFGIHKDVYCAGKESVFKFLQDILDEVMELFPSDIIHIGGDEVPKKRWKECPDCQARIKSEKLKDEVDLQVYFTNRIATYITSKGRQVMVWNDILHDELEENVIGQYWIGVKSKLRKHLKNGRKIVMSSLSHLYLDYNYETISLSKCYAYDPIPKRLGNFHHNILGIETPMWTEWSDIIILLYQYIFPRLLAVAETCWTPKENKNFKSFKNRLPSFQRRLDLLNINYTKLEEM